MYSSLVWLTLLGADSTVAYYEPSPAWITDYAQARRQGETLRKPLAVFLAPGKDGWQKLSREGKIDFPSLKMLAAGYICVHIDTTTDRGKQLAGAFNMSGGLGLVISDRSGELQAFRHEGSLPAGELSRHLERFAGLTSRPSRTETASVTVDANTSTSTVGAPTSTAPSPV